MKLQTSSQTVLFLHNQQTPINSSNWGLDICYTSPIYILPLILPVVMRDVTIKLLRHVHQRVAAVIFMSSAAD